MSAVIVGGAKSYVKKMSRRSPLTRKISGSFRAIFILRKFSVVHISTSQEAAQNTHIVSPSNPACRFRFGLNCRSLYLSRQRIASATTF